MAEVPHVVAVGRAETHAFSKPTADAITLVAGLGVDGDAHAGATVKHRSRVKVDPTQPNLRQVHLIHAELFDELCGRGFVIGPGDMGENVTTCGLDLLGLPTAARLSIGEAVIEVTGLRNPCRQLDAFRPGLMKAVLGRDAAGRIIRKAGIMGIVIAGGRIRPGDVIAVTLPPPPHRPLERV
jgi:MOSC domain-containing protein YiiM